MEATKTTRKVPLINKLAYALGTGGGNIFSQIAAAFLLQYYTDTALIGAGSIATMFLVCRVFDGISDLIMGGVVDKTNTKIGKARPWLILSGPLLLLGIVLLMHVPAGASESVKLVYAYATYIFMAVIVYTIYGIANTAMLPLMTHDKDESTMLATFSAIGNNLIGLIAGSLITPLVLNLGWHWSSIILGAASCVLVLFSGLINKEEAAEGGEIRRETVPMKEQVKAVLKNRYFFLLLLVGATTLIMNANAIGAQIYYCNLVLGNMGFMSTLMIAGQLPGLLILFLMPSIARKWSKQAFLLIGSVLLILGFVITGLAGTNTSMIVAGTIIRSFGAGPLLSAVFALVPDVVEYGNWKFGVRSEGLISSAQSIGSKVGIGLGSALTGWILAGVGYDPTAAVQTQSVINAIKFDYTWLGAIISVVILIIVLMLNVEKYAPEYMKQ
jgi:GPH family glycoside/pentoside/hexuronide:cation symporter